MKINYKECKKCDQWFINKQSYKYCPICGKELIQIILLENEERKK